MPNGSAIAFGARSRNMRVVAGSWPSASEAGRELIDVDFGPTSNWPVPLDISRIVSVLEGDAFIDINENA